MYISSSPHETKVAVLEDDRLVEVYFERDTDVGLVGGIYKGRVSRVLPGMQSAFVDIGLDRDAFLYVSDFYEDQEEYDKVFEEAEARATKFTAQQAVAAPATSVTEPAPAAIVEPAAPAAAPPAEPVPAEVPTATVAPAIPAAAPSAPRETHERRPFDSRRGRRRRHRGRPEFGEGRPVDRRFPPAHRVEEAPAESHPFEILPGESLAKYSHPGLATETSSSEADISYNPLYDALEGPEAEPQDKMSDEARSVLAADAGDQANQMSEEALVNPASSDAQFVPESEASPEPSVNADHAAALEPTLAFTPGAVYSEHHPAAVEVSAASPDHPSAESASPAPASPVEPQAAAPETVIAEPEPEKISTPLAPASEEVAAAYTPDGIAQPLAVEAEPPEPRTEEAAPETQTSESAEATRETPSERAESNDLEEDGEESEEEGEEFEDPEDELGSEGDLSGEPEPEVVAAGEAEGQAVSEAVPGDAPAAAGTGAPGDRAYTLREPHQRPRFAPRRRRGRRGGPGGGGPRRFDKPRESSRPGNNHPVQIAEVLKEGQEILVQIAKEPLGTKGARITSHVALPGRYLVFMPTIEHIGVSRKISSEEERLRLRNIIMENRGSLTGGFIVRTAGQGRSEDEFKADLKFLSTLWSEIRAKSDRLKAPALIHRDLDLVQRLLRDLLTPDFKCVRVDNEVEYERVLDFASRCQPGLVGKVKLYTRDAPLYEEFGIQQEIEKALKPKVWLKSGGYIVINQTEALVAIDVNTGKFVGKTNRLEDTIVKTNVDAVNEIVRQVRLRDLGGIIVIDFIDMDERKNRAKVVQALEEALHSDRAPTKVISFNDFGLVAITRKRVKQSLERTLCVPCNYCSGSGWVKSVHTVCNEILAEARKMAKGIDGPVITVRVNPEVAIALKSREGSLVSELESLTKKDVIIKGDSNVHQERFEIF
jgi:ribonuclease G